VARKAPRLNVPASDGSSERSDELEDYRSLAPNEEPVEPYFMRPTTCKRNVESA
jgi:hypothetical protein